MINKEQIIQRAIDERRVARRVYEITSIKTKEYSDELQEMNIRINNRILDYCLSISECRITHEFIENIKKETAVKIKSTIQNALKPDFKLNSKVLNHITALHELILDDLIVLPLEEINLETIAENYILYYGSAEEAIEKTELRNAELLVYYRMKELERFSLEYKTDIDAMISEILKIIIDENKKTKFHAEKAERYYNIEEIMNSNL